MPFSSPLRAIPCGRYVLHFGAEIWPSQAVAHSLFTLSTRPSLACWRAAVLEELILDGTRANDSVLPLLAPLAGTLELVSVVCPPDINGRRYITEEGVQIATEAFAERGGAVEFRH